MPLTEQNDGSASICTKPEFRPIRYHWYGGVDGEKVLHTVRRLIDEIDMPDLARERLKGEMAGRLSALKRGDLLPIHHIKGPMETVTDIDVFEVRGGVDLDLTTTVQFRIYHVEPTSLQRRSGSVVVGLHAHHKSTAEDEDVSALQDAELQTARRAYHNGRTTSWGGAMLPNS